MEMYTGLKVDALDFLSELSAKLYKASRQVLTETANGPTEAHFSYEDFTEIERIAKPFQPRSVANLILVPDLDVTTGYFELVCPSKTGYDYAHRSVFTL